MSEDILAKLSRVRVEMNEQPDLAAPETYLQRSDGSILLHKGAIGIGAQ